MEDLSIIVPWSVTLEDIGAVLGRTWKLDGNYEFPVIDMDHCTRAYVEEKVLDDDFMEEFFLGRPEMPECLQREFGDYRVMALRYRDPSDSRDGAGDRVVRARQAPDAGQR